ncbi:hypothetical protein ACHAXA_008532 [Cyclostephanos tholiformis]|uniref:Uncharacterized protein n=1 Tax=Cyclostephanos tholiformis TaxID=382380 RepID=A0ABD3R4S4_9STRA
MEQPLKRIDINMSQTVDSGMTSSSEPIRIISTKTYDGGYRNSHGSSENRFDAFLHYSNRETRMRALLGCRTDTNEETGRLVVPSSPTSACSNFPVVCRETRISFELHPSLLVGSNL